MMFRSTEAVAGIGSARFWWIVWCCLLVNGYMRDEDDINLLHYKGL